MHTWAPCCIIMHRMCSRTFVRTGSEQEQFNEQDRWSYVTRRRPDQKGWKVRRRRRCSHSGGVSTKPIVWFLAFYSPRGSSRIFLLSSPPLSSMFPVLLLLSMFFSVCEHISQLWHEEQSCCLSSDLIFRKIVRSYHISTCCRFRCMYFYIPKYIYSH